MVGEFRRVRLSDGTPSFKGTLAYLKEGLPSRLHAQCRENGKTGRHRRRLKLRIERLESSLFGPASWKPGTIARARAMVPVLAAAVDYADQVVLCNQAPGGRWYAAACAAQRELRELLDLWRVYDAVGRLE